MMDLYPGDGGKQKYMNSTPSHFMSLKPAISSGLMGHVPALCRLYLSQPTSSVSQFFGWLYAISCPHLDLKKMGTNICKDVLFNNKVK